MPLIGYRFENVLQAEPKMAYKRQSFIPIDYESTTLRILDVGYFIVSSFHAFHFHVPECRQEILSICLKMRRFRIDQPATANCSVTRPVGLRVSVISKFTVSSVRLKQTDINRGNS